MKPLISPSILASDLAKLGETVTSLDAKFIDLIHLDIMDAHFVPALTFGEQVSSALMKYTEIPADVHLMVQYPEKEVPKYFSLKPFNITFHYEAVSAPVRLANFIRENNIKAGIAINPSTPVGHLKDILVYFDLALLMSVEPGYYGQPFLEESVDRLAELKALCNEIEDKTGKKILIQMDGGISAMNAPKLHKHGVDIFVAGSYLFKGNPNENAKKLKGACNS